MPLGYWLEDQFSFITPLEALEDRLRELIRREAELDKAGVTCSLKDKTEMTCSCCPVHEVGQDTELSVLCRLGREEERIAALVITKQQTLNGGV